MNQSPLSDFNEIQLYTIIVKGSDNMDNIDYLQYFDDLEGLGPNDLVLQDASDNDFITGVVITAAVAVVMNAPKIYKFGKMAWNLYQAEAKAKA